MKRLRVMWASGLVMSFAGAAGTGLAAGHPGVHQRLNAAAQVFKDMAAPPGRRIPAHLLSRARCVVIIPNAKEGALIVGAEYGAGFLSCREGTNGAWSAPGGISLNRGTIGAEIGAGTKDIVMLAMNERAKDALLAPQSKLGTSVSALAGPVGHAPANMEAGLLTWTHSNGAFAGVSLKGSDLSQDNDANRALYGRALSNIEIVSGKVAVPPAAGTLMAALRDYSTRSVRASRMRRQTRTVNK